MGVDFIQDITGRDGSKDVDTNKRYRRTWIVRTSSPQDGASVVLAAAGIPAFNDPYQYTDNSDPLSVVVVTDDAVVAVDIKAQQDNPNDPQDWRVVVDYFGVEDPVSQPPEVEYSPTRYQKALVEDVNNVTVANTAGDPFEGGITVDRARFTLAITKAIETWDPVAALVYQETLNQNDFLAATHPPGFAPGTCKLTLGAKRMRRAGTVSFYWLRTAVIDIDREGWKVKVRNAGLRAYDATLNKAVQIIDAAGVPVSSPVLLAVDGAELPYGGTPLVQEFDGYETKDWNDLVLEYS